MSSAQHRHHAALTHRRLAAGLAIAGLVASGAAACSGDDIVPIGPYQLVAFDSCDNALRELRAAAKATVSPWGFMSGYRGGDVLMAEAADGAGAAVRAPAPAAAPAPGSYSGTNVHEEGVDEPDLVKTDGRRIVTVSDGRLRIVDVATRRLVGTVDLRDDDGGPAIGYEANLLLAGDHALIYGNDTYFYDMPVLVEDKAQPDAIAPSTPSEPTDLPVMGTSMLLVDLASPRVLARARADGYLVDARQVGSTVRLVLTSSPRLQFPYFEGTDDQRLAANRAIVDAAGIDAWAPRLEVTSGGQTVRTQTRCDAISRPAVYSGSSLLTVLTFDANRDTLDDGSPVSIVADGSTVYGDADSLYVASSPHWFWAARMPFGATAPEEARTHIYKFDTSSFVPRYVAGGSVPGHLINQYAMSEWDGRLRVATTTDGGMFGIMPDDGVPATQSGVYVLVTDGGQLRQVGAVEGLGKGERIYAVRFIGEVGYVVTFRQTDPLYTVDLSDPTAPVVRGELKIPGYSAYLHPMGDNRLIGVGQDATDTGQTIGAQVAIFDVANLDAPAQVAKFTLSNSYTEAEYDPHAFLYWPHTGMLVVPLESHTGFERFAAPTDVAQHRSGALVLRVDGDSIVEKGFVTHPVLQSGYPTSVRRSLVTVDSRGNTTLWTVSAAGVLASDAATLAQLAWIPL